MNTAVGLSTLVFALGAFAHGIIDKYDLDGQIYQGVPPYNSPDGKSSIQRYAKTFEPISDWNSPWIACNDDGRPNPGQQTAPIDAGKRINTIWTEWPHETGPMIAYLGKCMDGDCTSTNVNDIDWFKIAEEGLLDGVTARGYWGSTKMKNEGSQWAFDVPKGTPSGHYMLRVETISLHIQPAQSYPYCAQIEVTNGGGVEPADDQLVKFPGAYKDSDPGLAVNIWDGWDDNNSEHRKYAIPGPRLYTGAGASLPTGEGRPTEPSTPSEPQTPAEPSEPQTPTEPSEPTYPTEPGKCSKKKSGGWRKKARKARRAARKEALARRAKAKRAL